MPNIVNEDYTLEITNTSPGGVSAFGTPVESRNPSPFVKANSKSVLRGSIGYVFSPASPCVFAGHTFVSGAGSIVAGSSFVKTDGIPVLLEGDTGSCVGSFTNNGSGAPVPCSCQLRISDAGQSNLKGE